MNDKRNSLYVAMVKLAERLQPQAIVLENVPGMLQVNGGIGAKRIIQDFKEIGYDMVPNYYMLWLWGSTIRKRVFFVGLKNHNEFIFPDPFKQRKIYYL